MRFMVIVKATPESEQGQHKQEDFAAMGAYNEQLVNAGVVLSMEGLQPSRKGARVRFDGATRTIIDGPFTESKELVAGYWIWKCDSLAHAVEWLKKAPFNGGAEVEIRQVFELEDFGAELTPELREQERSQLARAAKYAAR